MVRNPARPRTPERQERVQTWIFVKNIDPDRAKFRGFHTGRGQETEAYFALKGLQRVSRSMFTTAGWSSVANTTSTASMLLNHLLQNIIGEARRF
jgi:hypothetical protein